MVRLTLPAMKAMYCKLLKSIVQNPGKPWPTAVKSLMPVNPSISQMTHAVAQVEVMEGFTPQGAGWANDNFSVKKYTLTINIIFLRI